MGILLDIVEEIGRSFFRLFFEIVMVATGETALWLFTGGRRKPRWDLYTSERASTFVVLSELSCWVGIATWLVAVAVIHQVASRPGLAL